MTADDLFGWAVAASLGVHVAGLALVPGLGLFASGPPPSSPVPVEVVRVPAPAPPPPAPPKPERAKRPKTPPRPAVAERPALAPIQPSQLIDEQTALDVPMPAAAPRPNLLPNAVTSGPAAAVPGPREGGPAGAGELFSTEDIPVRAGVGTGADSGAGGRSGTGLASRGSAEPAGAAGVTAFARPLGGYQTLPRYPESARRLGVQGVAVLRFVVEADGRVGTVKVDSSAGNADLDEAAVEAVRSWRFEPARRGKEPVPVWVTLPVRFSLMSR